ncbi:trihelix transcription factor ASIL1 [Tripterygium wilfordii]|uniref:Trihelix transcription factor ASIL1 n=1 Tax=Tripterygium wilfordii TaxID=458696 RepID=A0A7J7CHX9_TRIWF|nr:trihelix transcription factor ASIL2-like [Tripterygium wilfordii]KAF5733641.1 trihelix transcription factor ASIL1 [Tripterygium wilfordii]
MNNQTNQENPSLLPTTATIKDDSPRKLPGGGGGGGGGDRLKRDEWSEGAVSTLLEAYESKWVLRNRAKLKGHDWEDVARYVSLRANCTKSPKTQTQCKNKIESMKKRYRSESATADGSSWPLYPRLDLLLRGSGPPQPPPPPPALPPPLLQVVPVSNNIHPPPPLMLLEPSPILQESPATVPPPPPPISSLPNTAQNSHGSNGVERVAKEDGEGARLSDNFSDKNIAMESTDCSTPAALYSDKEKPRCKKMKMKMKQQMDYNKKNNNNKKRSSSSRRPDHHHHHNHNHQEVEIAESIRWLAQVVVRSEQARMDTMREIEKMRIEAEAKRGELDLKRTEIIANTQLEIAKIFATVNKGVDSSLRIGRS